jgi:hypothetical protein
MFRGARTDSRSCGPLQQGAQAGQVVRCRMEDDLPFPLTDVIARVAGGATVDGTPAAVGLGVLRHVRRDGHLPRRVHEISGVVVLIASDRDAAAVRQLAKTRWLVVLNASEVYR